MSVLQHYAEIITDPAHTLVEFTFVLLDYLVISAVAKRLKAHFHKDIAMEHEVLDVEHGITQVEHDNHYGLDERPSLLAFRHVRVIYPTKEP